MTRQEWVDREVAKWKPRLLLDSWSILVEVKDKDLPPSGDELTLASMLVNGRYNEAILRIYPALFSKPAAYRKATIVHELLHIQTDSMRTVLFSAHRKGILSEARMNDLAEGITEYIAKVLVAAYTGKRKKGYHL